MGELETTTDPDCDEDDCADPVQKFRPIRILHPKSYSKPAPFKHDVALIKLDRDVTITGAYINSDSLDLLPQLFLPTDAFHRLGAPHLLTVWPFDAQEFRWRLCRNL